MSCKTKSVGLPTLTENIPLMLTLIFLAMIAVNVSATPPRAATDHPNLIVVLLDDAGYGDFSITGNPTTQTPSLERLSREGLRFSQFYCATAACTASRYSLLTGR